MSLCTEKFASVRLFTTCVLRGPYKNQTRGGVVMLILTRRLGECLKIGDEVTVTVLGVKGGQVRLGFTAPPEVAVHREEVYERIKAERFQSISKPVSPS